MGDILSMFEKLNSNARRWIINGVIAFAVTLLFLGFIVGKLGGKEEVNKKITSNVSENQKENAGKTNALEKDDVPSYGELYVGYEEIKATEVNESLFHPTLSELFNETNLEITKQMAKDFMNNFYNFNGKSPIENIENSKEYLCEDLYNFLLEHPERPTATMFERKLISVEVFEPFAPIEEAITWDVKVVGEIIDGQGIKTVKTDVYLLRFGQKEEQFKITDFLVNFPH